MEHSNRKNLENDPETNAHETLHFLNSEVRNGTIANDNTMYFGNGVAALIPEPATKPAVVQNYIPASLKSEILYQTYLVKQSEGDWKDYMLYLFDEWSAYRWGSKVANEMIAAKTEVNFGDRSCIHDGASLFIIFGSSAVLALSDKEPAYLSNNEFKAMYAVLAEESVAAIKTGAGKRITDCDASKNLEYFKTSPELQRQRDVIKNWLGASWTSQTFGF
jgi:hypothetical protein